MAIANPYEKGDYYYPEPYIHTRSGRFYLHDPRFVATDIAHALSMLCRFNGHTLEFYSVAEHSLLVAELMRDETGGDSFEGLMHDATEAYLSDIPTPFKRLLPDWAKFDAPLDLAMRKWAGLPEEMTEECRRADKLALFIEADWLIPEQGADFIDTYGVRPRAREIAHKYVPYLSTPRQAKAMWLYHYGSRKK